MRVICEVSLLLALLFSFTGCAQLNSIHRTLDVNEGKGALIDIKQRAIIVKKRGNEIVVCAEPSPEALSAYAAEVAGKVDVPAEISAELASAFQEGSSYVGLRTQSIQLLRDSLYRLCEGYANGALDRAQYSTLMRRYQKYMVALLGIEQLTGAVRTPPATVSTQGVAETSRAVSEMQKEMERISGEIKALEESRKSVPNDPEALKKIDEKLALLAKHRKSLEQGIQTGLGLIASGSATAAIVTVGDASGRSDAHIQAVSGDVKRIVSTILGTDDKGQLCWEYLYLGGQKDPALADICLRYLEQANVYIKHKNDYLKKRLDAYRSSPPGTAEEMTELNRLFDDDPVRMESIRPRVLVTPESIIDQ
jgi:hypothetical protein